jgi:hypothetical protein
MEETFYKAVVAINDAIRHKDPAELSECARDLGLLCLGRAAVPDEFVNWFCGMIASSELVGQHPFRAFVLALPLMFESLTASQQDKIVVALGKSYGVSDDSVARIMIGSFLAEQVANELALNTIISVHRPEIESDHAVALLHDLESLAMHSRCRATRQRAIELLKAGQTSADKEVAHTAVEAMRRILHEFGEDEDGRT